MKTNVTSRLLPKQLVPVFLMVVTNITEQQLVCCETVHFKPEGHLHFIELLRNVDGINASRMTS